VREAWPGKHLVVAFQPHRYTRTRDLFDDLCQVLSTLETLVLCEVYPAGENAISGDDGRALARGVRVRGRVDPVFIDDVHVLPQVLADVVEEGDVLLARGAGDIGSVARRMAQQTGVTV